jgi:predicted amino acid racemase
LQAICNKYIIKKLLNIDIIRVAGEKDLKKEYPLVEIDLEKIRNNIDEMVVRCARHGISVAGVVKAFNGIPQIMGLFGESGCTSIASSRLEHLEEARMAGIPGPYMAIRIPMLSEIEDLVRLADFSLQSDLTAILSIEKECLKQDKTHSIILMADLGDLREGFWDRKELIAAALTVENTMERVYLAGIGTNLGCYGSVCATPEKLANLVDIAEDIEKAIGRELDIISGGGSTSVPLVLNGTMPGRINHLRIGEAICLSYDLDKLWGLDVGFMHQDAFTLKVEIVEIRNKPTYPVGELFVDCFGNRGSYEDRGIRKRAIVALGKLDFAFDTSLIPRLEGVEIIGSSSDHLILDIEDVPIPLSVGDILEFDLVYASLLYLTSSRYVKIGCR